MTTASTKHLIRRDTHHTHGWEVRVVRSKGTVRELFSDSTYGGKPQSLKEAKKFRDIVTKRIPRLNRKEIAEHPTVTNREEGVGVSFARQKIKRKNTVYTYEFYQAFWSPEKGKHKSKKFSIKKYGKKLAYTLAVQARKKGVREMVV